MNDHFTPRGLIRMAVALFVASMAVSFFGLTGPLRFMVFLGIYFAVSYIFHFSADQLEEDHSRQPLEDKVKEHFEQAWGKEGQKTTDILVEDAVFLDQRVQKAIGEVIPNLDQEALNLDTTFSPILPGDDSSPSYQADKNQVLVTIDLFTQLLATLGGKFNIQIPDEKLNDWAMETDLGEISTWLTNHEPVAEA